MHFGILRGSRRLRRIPIARSVHCAKRRSRPVLDVDPLLKRLGHLGHAVQILILEIALLGVMHEEMRQRGDHRRGDEQGGHQGRSDDAHFSILLLLRVVVDGGRKSGGGALGGGGSIAVFRVRVLAFGAGAPGSASEGFEYPGGGTAGVDAAGGPVSSAGGGATAEACRLGGVAHGGCVGHGVRVDGFGFVRVGDVDGHVAVIVSEAASCGIPVIVAAAAAAAAAIVTPIDAMFFSTAVVAIVAASSMDGSLASLARNAACAAVWTADGAVIRRVIVALPTVARDGGGIDLADI
mmetsp:Transcript_18381/g.37135  ORF Transcript_18381/g.37135 Transcript_18381/m.37135 type:complete len:294 (+) Transcript_18381:2146-3027(+)